MTQNTQPSPANPTTGRMAGWEFTCPRPGCPERHGTTFRSMTERHERSHMQWHEGRDRERQPFARQST